MNAINFTPARNGKASAVCQCCGFKSRAVPVDRHSEPSMWELPRGWSQAPFPHDTVHRDGSVGSFYTCPQCNKRLAAGEALMVRGTQRLMRRVPA